MAVKTFVVLFLRHRSPCFRDSVGNTGVFSEDFEVLKRVFSWSVRCRLNGSCSLVRSFNCLAMPRGQRLTNCATVSKVPLCGTSIKGGATPFAQIFLQGLLNPQGNFFIETVEMVSAFRWPTKKHLIRQLFQFNFESHMPILLLCSSCL